jgi:hypothetical protein
MEHIWQVSYLKIIFPASIFPWHGYESVKVCLETYLTLSSRPCFFSDNLLGEGLGGGGNERL